MSVNTSLTAIADAIRAKTGKTNLLTLGQMAAEIAGIQTDTGNNPLDYVSSIRYLLGSIKPTDPADIVLSFGNDIPDGINGEALSYVFSQATNIRSIKISSQGTADGVSMSSFARINSRDATLVRVDFTGAQGILKITNISYAFQYRAALREILGEFDMTPCTATQNAFARCDVLETVHFKAGTLSVSIGFPNSPKLTEESIQSIIDSLKNLTGLTAQTLTFHADVGTKLTEAQKTAVSAKNWTIAY